MNNVDAFILRQKLDSLQKGRKEIIQKAPAEFKKGNR